MEAADKRNYALESAEKCELAARFFGRRAKRRERIRNLAHATELLAAVMALGANLPFMKHAFNVSATEYVETVALIVLIFVVIVDRVFGKDPPERLQDYALYLRLYGGRITTLLHSKSHVDNDAKIDVLVQIVEDNIADVSAKWPDITEFIESNSQKR